MAITLDGTNGIDSPDLNITGTGARITGDFSNATLANRVLFQSSTTNGATAVGALPNGSSTVSQFLAFNSTDPGNSSYIQAFISGTEARLLSGQLGTGTNLPLTMYTGGSERMRITSDGYLRMSSGSGGIQFGGDTAAANALDDYEEGTWTPAFGDGAGPNGTTTVSNATYRKIGSLVVATCDISMSAKGSLAGADLALVYGLPFSALSVSGIGGASVDLFLNLGSNVNYISATSQGDTTLLFRTTSSTTSTMNNATYSGLYAVSARFFLTITYFAA